MAEKMNNFQSQRESVTPQVIEKQASIWPTRPAVFPDPMTPVEAAQYLRLDEAGHTPQSALRTLNYWRDRGELKATKYARRVWFLKAELDEFLHAKTEKK